MDYTLGNTGITTNKVAFGALPIQRVSAEEAVGLLRRALDGGVTFFDTARGYTDSEEKLGKAFSGLRDRLFIATKTGATTPEAFRADLEKSLRNLRTDHIDVYQFHNPAFVPRPGDGSGLYECMLEAKKEGKILHIGITNHRIGLAEEIVESGLYETLQYPFCLLASERDIALVERTRAAGMGFIAMKALSGGLITNARAACAFLDQYPVLPIYGVQRPEELEEFLAFVHTPPELTEELQAVIAADRAQLGGDFCRGCGYCMPCPQGIQINTCARMSLLLRRSPSAMWLSEMGQGMMKQAEKCVECRKCVSKCPYGLDTPALLKRNLEDYRRVLAGEVRV
ncbi:MAG: aldo/keto reductase [Oscillospiraceae bacterium]|nr:aldo/keto reductase [Oscillospiraceae bacterium]